MTEKEKLNERKITNPHNIANLGDKIFIDHSANGGRSGLPSYWGVRYIGRSFKGCLWYEYGAKTFIGKKREQDVFLKALKFAAKVIKQNEWVKTPHGGYVSKYTADKVGFKYKPKDVNKAEG